MWFRGAGCRGFLPFRGRLTCALFSRVCGGVSRRLGCVWGGFRGFVCVFSCVNFGACLIYLGDLVLPIVMLDPDLQLSLIHI